ncbi:PilC/PilY family type IV pilus protein [Cupriavidus sp. WKF15]|uniref:PilC/PilY family type IV pilus protein n=1 Tax=Cupriavidus sp. WKF15 TaxID=3032282 RepID=UPI0023E25914|nr:PilC/PilY family type IV pilus protein [Cupriavidus sp. WKF15]WER45115.1 PilC/PilY family type IV pilus protein [Cupriavidus sp. WKF15]
MSPLTMIVVVLAWLLPLSSAAWAGTVADMPAGNLPLAYQSRNGAYPWTGRLYALGWSLQHQAPETVPHERLWEAGAALDAKPVAARRLYTSVAPTDPDSERLVPLQWPALDAAGPLKAPGAGNGVSEGDKLAWLRGERNNTALRPRETRMANARVARVLVVRPPQWQPGKAGHAAFRERHRTRPHMVWLGTTDALLHGFDAVNGEELVAYLPRTLLPQAIAMADPNGALAPAPCPRPEAADVVIRREWRTVLLCGMPGAAKGDSPPGVFALDITDPTELAPLRLLWEMTATASLPLSARGPVRAAAFAGNDGLRSFAVTTVDARSDSPASRPGLALIPLDQAAGESAQTWPLPERDCTGAPVTSAIAGVSVLSDMTGATLAIYATDDSGQLWHFPLADATRRLAPGTPSCRHRLPVVAGTEHAEPPLLTGSSASPLVIYGQGREIAAIPSRSGGSPTRITAQPADGGFLLRAPPGQHGTAAEAGWHLTLPNPGEQLDALSDAFPGYLHFTTRAADGLQRAYLVLAATGESAGRTQEGAPLQAFVTGQAVAAEGGFVLTSTPGSAPRQQAGASSTHAHTITLWAVDQASARPLSTTIATRRTGRISWREVVAPMQRDAP